MTLNPSTKRSSRRKESRPSEILAAAIPEFAKNGFERAQLARIAKAAGISKATIYLYFANKEELFEAAVQTNLAQILDGGDENFAHFEGSTEELIRDLLGRVYESIDSSHAEMMMRILLTESSRFPGLTSLFHEKAVEKAVGVLEKLISRGIERGEILPSPMTDVPELIMAPAIYLIVNRIAFQHESRLSRKEFFEGHVDMIVRSLVNSRT